MSEPATLEVPDLSEFFREVRALPERIQQRVLKGACATGASVMRKAAIALAPEWTGDVQKGHPPPGTLKRAIYQTRMVQMCTPVQEVWKVDVVSAMGVLMLERAILRIVGQIQTGASPGSPEDMPG